MLNRMTTKELLSIVQEKAKANLETVTDWRRHLHQNPELSFQEENTSKYISEKLDELGIEHTRRIAQNGIVGIIEGNDQGPVCALRADMDALPILEANEVSYKSQNEGVMHACGHDAHTASLLGAAKILQETKSNWKGTVKLIFQPAEEKAPGGAKQMISEGVLENPTVNHVVGQHVFPYLEAGQIGIRPGMYMASADEIYLKVIGKGGHAAAPEHNIDPVLIASHLVVALQQVISRRASPKTPTVLSFGKVVANGATNVIPNEVHLEGTFRAMNEEWREEAHGIITKLARELAESMGGSCEVNIVKGYPYLENNPELSSYLKEAAQEYVGEENVFDLDIWMAGEDFAYFTHNAPSCFYRFGTGNKAEGITSPVHSPTFNIDEKSLETGMGFMAWSAIRLLNS